MDVQYDYEILQQLQQINIAISRLEGLFNTLLDNWFPILIGAVLTVAVISVLNWLVKV